MAGVRICEKPVFGCESLRLQVHQMQKVSEILLRACKRVGDANDQRQGRFYAASYVLQEAYCHA